MDLQAVQENAEAWPVVQLIKVCGRPGNGFYDGIQTTSSSLCNWLLNGLRRDATDSGMPSIRRQSVVEGTMESQRDVA